MIFVHKKKIRENGSKLKKKRRRRYPTKTITDDDYADDIAILANTPNQAEALLHSLEQAAAGIDLRVNAHKAEYMCYNILTTGISILNNYSDSQDGVLLLWNGAESPCQMCLLGAFLWIPVSIASSRNLMLPL